MEGLTPEQAAQAAQWGPDIGPPGPVSYILHVLMSQEQDAAISGQSPEGSNAASGSANESPASGAPADSQPTPTSTFDNVSSSTTAPSTFETSASTPSTTQETTSSAPASASDTPSTSQDTSSSFSTDPATTSSSRPQFSPSTTTFSVSATSTGISYDPIGGSISYDPATSSIDSSSTSSSPSSTSPTPAGDFGAESTGSSSSSMANMSNAHKKAIVGGLAGAIGALVIVGLLLCFCLRRRHKRGDEEDDDEEDGLKKPVKPATKWNTAPSTVRLWSDLALGRAPGRSTPEISKPRTPSPADGNVIRVSTEHWSRPFRTKEGLRDSLEPEPLRVVNANPDSSRSSTPQDERRPGFVRKQRSALAAFLQDGARSNSRNAVKRGPISYPKPMPGDPVYSSKATVDSGADNQSLGSLPSNTSSPMVVQKPPEDPFMASSPMLTTMEEVMPPMEQARPRQTAPTQERTVSHFGKNANPFRNQIVPSVALPPRIFSYSNPNMRASNVQKPTIRRSSIGSTYSQKTRRDTAATTTMPRESDQFDLMISPDQMPPASGILAKTQEFEERQQDKKQQQQRDKEITPSVESSPNWVLYEGT